MHTTHEADRRVHAFDALRGFALLLGVAFHAALSFLPWPPGLWAMKDVSSSTWLNDATFVSHLFRMSLFFFLAGFFARLLHQRHGSRGFWANRLRRIALPLAAGWVVLFPLTSWVWTTGMAKLFADAPPPPASPEPATAGAFPLLHLWFLYLLLLLYAGFLAVRAVVVRLDHTGTFRAAAERLLLAGLRWPAAVFVLGLPLALCLVKLPVWYYWQGIPTPDRSLVPQLAATVGYGTAFGVGWLVHRSTGALAVLAARWLVHLGIGLAATVWCLQVVRESDLAAPGATTTLYAIAYGVAIWGWVFGLAGAALRFLSQPSAPRRYVAEASYWIYLVHLPLVCALQVWVGDWPLGWGVKFPLVLGVSLALLFASYHWLVRPTALGRLLGGPPARNTRPAGAASPVAAPAQPLGDDPSSAPAGVGAPVVARLQGVEKRFGATTALAGVDLEVRAGELLAVLGPNGAGKSTAISLWLGIAEPDRGRAELFGADLSAADRGIAATRQGVGVMLQDVELPKELRVAELVRLASSYYAQALPLAETLARSGTSGLAGRRYGELSGGQKRQVQFALAICGQPRLLFLDEPTVGLDVQARAALWAAVRRLLADGCAIVLTTHYLEEAEALASQVAVLAGGRRIAHGSVDEIRAVVDRRRVSCESSLAVDEVRRWPEVVEVDRDGTRLNLVAKDGEAAVRRLLAADPGLRRLEVRGAGLEEAFQELTKEAA
jgi:ABC-type multidrug transport system ATPase subunit/peptidoglycan/LPS O-acetylase OafA/YrhL